MRKVYKRIISLVLVVTMLVCFSLPVFAADVAEEYICDLRLIYADDYDAPISIAVEVTAPMKATP